MPLPASREGTTQVTTGSKSIPERWENYSPCGEQIGDSPFVAFKVPLKPCMFNKHTSMDRKWTLQIMLEKLLH